MKVFKYIYINIYKKNTVHDGSFVERFHLLIDIY